MRKKRLILIVVPVAALVIALVWGTTRAREPEYQGKKLSEWVDLISREIDPSRPTEADIAIRQIGPKAVPYLVKWMRIDGCFLTRKMQPLFIKLHPRGALQRTRRGYGAFKALFMLGPQAEGAIPALKKMLLDPNTTPRERLYAIVALPALEGHPPQIRHAPQTPVQTGLPSQEWDSPKWHPPQN